MSPKPVVGPWGCPDCASVVWRDLWAEPRQYVVVHDTTCPWVPPLLAGFGAAAVPVELGELLVHVLDREGCP